MSAENIKYNLVKTPKLNNTFRFLYSGSYGVKDGIDILLKAFMELSKFYPAIELILSGKINSSINKIIQDISQIRFVD
ncbi:MAG: hypothetical protein IPJ23_05900 [Ignavibacteriales bacterium]|nr:hypothetical protein [Ignavibacteriales bacterium]